VICSAYLTPRQPDRTISRPFLFLYRRKMLAKALKLHKSKRVTGIGVTISSFFSLMKY